MSQIKDDSYTQNRHNTLVYRLVDLIATHPGIGHNELKEFVKDKEHLTTTKTYDKTIKGLLKDETIERKRGKGKRVHYYIYDQFEHKIIKYDKKFDKKISEVKRLIHKIERNFPDYDDYTAQNAFDALDSIKSRCLDVIYRHKNQDDVNLHLEDSLVDDIKYYMKEKSDETIQELYTRAQVTCDAIKKSRKETETIITKLLKTKSSRKTKQIEKLIENSKIWKLNREELIHLEKIVGRRVSYLNIDPKKRHWYVEPK